MGCDLWNITYNSEYDKVANLAQKVFPVDCSSCVTFQLGAGVRG